MLNEKKSSVLYVLEVLKEFSDKNHPMTYLAIADKLQKLYGIEIERKTIARDVDILIDKGYDIVKRGNYGLYLGMRDFEEGELLFLIDAVYSSRSIPTKYARDLVEKLTASYSNFEKKRFAYLEKLDQQGRFDNKQIFYTIEILNEAIERGKKVKFLYNAFGIDKKFKPKNGGKFYTVNPYYLVNSRGKYYLVCNYEKYDNLANYKIEAISNIEIVDEDARPVQSLPGQKDFSIKQYINEHIYMVAGKSVQATLKLDNEDRINDVIDWFGDNVRVVKQQENVFVDLTVNEEALVYWALQYGQAVEIVKPLSTRQKVKDVLSQMIKKYEENC